MTILTIGNESINSEDVAHKVEADIAFLTDRLQLLRQQNNPNPVIIQTYQGMLESRQSLLAWLLQENKKVSNG
jgi:hypothetical protein